MENASKALIIAGAILISILLISVGILIFNSTSGTTDSAGLAGDAMEIAARKERVKMILSTVDLKDEDAAFNYITSNYGKWLYINQGNINNSILKTVTAEEAREICELIMQRSIMFYGTKYEDKTIHLTTSRSTTINGETKDNKVYYASNEVIDNLEDNKIYEVGLFRNVERGHGYSVSIREQ